MQRGEASVEEMKGKAMYMASRLRFDFDLFYAVEQTLVAVPEGIEPKFTSATKIPNIVCTIYYRVQKVPKGKVNNKRVGFMTD